AGSERKYPTLPFRASPTAPACNPPALKMAINPRRSTAPLKQVPQASPPAPTVARDRWAAAVRHLRRVDPHLRAIIDRVGSCQLEPSPDRFGALVRSIV